MEQRKVHMLARDVLPSIDREPPTSLHTPLIADLGTGRGKMSSSEGVTISMEDSREDIESKVNDAYCPRTADPEPTDDGQSRENPVLQVFEYHVFPRFDTVVVERPEEVRRRLGVRQLRRLRGGAGVGRTPPRRREGGARGVPQPADRAGAREQLAE